MRFFRLALENWRNFKSVDVALQQRIFIAGPNASGKSNLLDAMNFLRQLASPGGGLQNAVVDRGGISKVRCLAARRYSDISFAVSIGEDEGEWTYSLTLSQDNNRRPIVKTETVTRGGEIIRRRPDEDDKKDAERLTQTHLEQVSANADFRSIADFLASIRYLHVVPQLIREPERHKSRLEKERDPYGSDFLEQIAKASDRVRNSRLLTIMNALTIALPQLQALELERDQVGVPHLRGRFEHWRPKAGWQREDQFSDGTLRLIGLLWAVLDGSGPLLLEEPELSLHPRVVEFIPQMLWNVTRKRRRQIAITTHSPEMLSDKGIGADEVLLLHPSAEGTKVEVGNENPKVTALLKSGLSAADAALSLVSPEHPERLAEFSE
ncbi:MAG TPA: AAA family ATPase [Xanthobacteraceae bacterium]|nr:AAA family ATPase [Xanthobacteraceae bacterium]